MTLCIGFLGADWWGSDARAVAVELRHQGNVVIERHYEDYLPTRWRSNSLRAARRLLSPLIRSEYNRSVRELVPIEALDFLLVFKGMLLDPKTLELFRRRGTPCYCIYPDVSFHDHGKNIWACLPKYDCVFTTKSYHLDDRRIRGRLRDMRWVRHGFDPEVHRPIQASDDLTKHYGSDVAFVGLWSAKKESLLRTIAEDCPEVDLRIWGPGWQKSHAIVRNAWQGRGAYGDEAAAIYSLSRINLGLLSEAGGGTQQGDVTTARTWQIPASRGFLLHEHTLELSTYFEIGREVATFQNPSDLVKQIRFFLANDEQRNMIRDAGHARCHSAPYSYASTVAAVTEYHLKHRGN